MFKIIMLIIVALTIKIEAEEQPWFVSNNSLITYFPCNDTDEITVSFEPGKEPEDENEYTVFINITLPKYTHIEINFDQEATVKLSPYTRSTARIFVWRLDTFSIRFFRDADTVSFTVKGPPLDKVPYITSLKINTQQYCESPRVGYLDQYISGYSFNAETTLKIPQGCGRRKVEHTELIVNGQTTKPGDWPWHAAIYRFNKASFQYICGGTLISNTVVLTAAHCVTVRGQPISPEILSAVLGKYNLIGGDLESQERKILSIKIHGDFAPTNFLDNDIALLTLKTEATYNNYVQPACVWYNDAANRLPEDNVFGTVVGWGVNQTDKLSDQLTQANMPIVSDAICVNTKPVFYANALNNNKKFCAGFTNGTSACNGDSGGGFVVFVPDTRSDDSANAVGAWYLKGIVSLSLTRKNSALCDPNYYVVFTDISKYVGWIQRHLTK